MSTSAGSEFTCIVTDMGPRYEHAAQIRSRAVSKVDIPW